MGLSRLLALSLVLVACGGDDPAMQQMTIDAPGTSNGCAMESDCSAPTPYCEPATSTCVQCRFSSHCTSSNGVCEAQACRAARSCKELKAELPGLPSGVYRIDVDGDGAAMPVDSYCEMTVDGGGWTLVQRTRWAWTASQSLHTDFATWHDTTMGTPAIGTAFRLAGVHWPALATQGELMVSHRVRTASGAACNPLWYVATGGTLTVNQTAKTVDIVGLTEPANLVNMAGAASLSTTDSGPTASATCISTNSGVPWFYGSCCATCPTYQGSYWTDEPHPMESYTGTTADFFGKIEADVCAGQAVQMAVPVDTPYRGVDTMEMYLR